MKKNEKEVVVKKRKFKLAKFLIVLLILYVILLYAYKIVVAPINNIYITNNKYLSDQEVIDISGLRDYPSYLLSFKYNIKKKLESNNLINKVKVKKEFGRIVSIDVTENELLFIYDNMVILSNNRLIENKGYNLPSLTGEIDVSILNKLVEKYENVNDEIRLMISEIKYDPNDIDKERFLLTMNDGNYVYVTLYKISAINDYIKILSNTSLDGKKGIIYLDSGNYFEVLND